MRGWAQSSQAPAAFIPRKTNNEQAIEGLEVTAESTLVGELKQGGGRKREGTPHESRGPLWLLWCLHRLAGGPGESCT